MKTLKIAAAMALLAAPAVAQDAANGEALFNRQCATCHVVENDAGEVLAGRNAKIGPNLFHAIGRQPGTYDGFKYGDSMVKYGETGVVWGEENFEAYVQDPTGFLRTALDDKRARGKMMFQLRKETDAKDMYAFLSQFAMDGAESGDAAAGGDAAKTEPAKN